MNFLLSSSRYSALWCPRCATPTLNPKVQQRICFWKIPNLAGPQFGTVISSSKHPCLRGELFQRSKFWEHIFIDSHFQSLSPSVRLKKGRFRECPPRKKSQQHAVHSKLGFKDVCLASLRSTLSLGPLVHCLLWIELIYPKLLGSPQMTFNFT